MVLALLLVVALLVERFLPRSRHPRREIACSLTRRSSDLLRRPAFSSFNFIRTPLFVTFGRPSLGGLAAWSWRSCSSWLFLLSASFRVRVIHAAKLPALC